MAAGAAPVTLYAHFTGGRNPIFPFHQVTRIGSKRRQAGLCVADRADTVCVGEASRLLFKPLFVGKRYLIQLAKNSKWSYHRFVADSSWNPADEWEGNLTLDGGVPFSFYTFCFLRFQIPSYRIPCHMQEKSVLFFTARCMSYDFNTEILICGDCAVAAPFKMPFNT